MCFALENAIVYEKLKLFPELDAFKFSIGFSCYSNSQLFETDFLTMEFTFITIAGKCIDAGLVKLITVNSRLSPQNHLS